MAERIPGFPFLYSGACAACLAAGIYLGRHGEASREATRPVEKASPRRAASEASGSWSAPDTAAAKDAPDRMLMLKRGISACETDALWRWLADPEGPRVARKLVLNELIDRLGWGAWDHVRGMEAGEAKDRARDQILVALAERDPWKAHEEWQRHHGEFQHKLWGFGVISECSRAAAAMSADQLLKAFESIPRKEASELMMVEYAADFDFRKVLDHVAAGGSQPYTMTQDLLSSWAGRDPEEAAAWLVAHPDYLKIEYQRDEAGDTLGKIAAMEMSEETRARLLGDLGTLPRELIDQTWRNISTGTEGKLSPALLRSADLMGQRGVYLEGALMDTRALESLDASWEAVPLQQRGELLEKVERRWEEQGKTPVEAKARAVWREMVEREWGMR